MKAKLVWSLTLGAALLAGIQVAYAGYTYVDSAGTRLRLLNEPCAAPGAVELFMVFGVPPQVAVAAQGAEVIGKGRTIAACYVVHPSGTVYMVAPEIGEGMFTLPVDAFVEETKV